MQSFLTPGVQNHGYPVNPSFLEIVDKTGLKPRKPISTRRGERIT